MTTDLQNDETWYHLLSLPIMPPRSRDSKILKVEKYQAVEDKNDPREVPNIDNETNVDDGDDIGLMTKKETVKQDDVRPIFRIGTADMSGAVGRHGVREFVNRKSHRTTTVPYDEWKK
jgi:hypothetical protein